MTEFDADDQDAPAARVEPGRALVGRGETLAVLRRFIDSSGASGGSLLLIGQPGVGKTALLDAVAAFGQDSARVVRAAGVEFEADVSFAGLHQVLHPLIDHLADLTDHHRAALSVALGMSEGTPAGRLVVAAAALALLGSAAADQPLMIVIDDLAWLDRPSSQVLGFVARRLQGTRVAFLAALRTAEQSYFEQAGIPLLQVCPLDESTSADLVRRTFPAVADGVCNGWLPNPKAYLLHCWSFRAS